jgi:diguanylate cyclase (GGDEF)-like protein
VADKNRAGKTLAGKTLAGKSLAGRNLASTPPGRLDDAAPRPAGRRLAGTTEQTAARPRATTAAKLAEEVERLASELKASRSKILELEARIEIDSLTGTLNRRGFERELARSLAYVKRYGASAALIFIDLDDFKPVNDRHGHAAGDAVLTAVAGAIAGELRASDVVARIGGDEFVALVWNVSPEIAAAKAAAIEAGVLRTAVRWGASTLVVGASAGVAMVEPLDTPAEVLARADAAMYARKSVQRARGLSAIISSA